MQITSFLKIYLIVTSTHGFQTSNPHNIDYRRRPLVIVYSSKDDPYGREKVGGRYLDEFRTAEGDVVDPYKVLRVSRKAERMEIKQSYRALVKKYHPDMAKQTDILPGSCNNLDDVMSQWERIKLSYEILEDPKRRNRYNRQVALADPSKAVQRAATDAVFGFIGWGVKGIGKGIYKAGEMAVTKVSDDVKTGRSRS
mmetsp:Transcript_6427/g.8079  ORF Transcript_6427/g.8079 Transcript_6427/m.8079 type:complete len:197 (+) Transcript_6427:135-725(+)